MNSISLPVHLNVDSVAVLKTHFITITLVIIILVLIGKLILPQVLNYYKTRFHMEKEILQNGITKLVDGQDKMNSALIHHLDRINTNMMEIKNLFVGSLKATGKVLSAFILMLCLTFSACDSDTLVIYHIKQDLPKQEVKQGSQIEIKTPVKTDTKIDEPIPLVIPDTVKDKAMKPFKAKTCSPPCTGNTYCNDQTGKCEGIASQNNQKPLSALEFVMMDKVGTFDRYTETFEITGGHIR